MKDRTKRARCLPAIATPVLLFLAGEPTIAADHQSFDSLLRVNVKAGHVRYRGFRDHPLFAGYLDAIAGQDPDALVDDDERLSFYINAYNALVIQSVLEGRSPATLLGRMRFFKLHKHAVAGESISLYDLEHQRLLSAGDARVHFAIVCASMSCPPLRSEAYDPARLDEQLDDQAILFVNDKRHNAFDRANGVASVSKIFRWYRDDFSWDGSGIEQFLAFYVDDPLLADDLRAGRLRLKYRKYDWSLNGDAP